MKLLVKGVILGALLVTSGISGSSIVVSAIDYVAETASQTVQIKYKPKGSSPMERSKDFVRYLQKKTGNTKIKFGGFLTERGISYSAKTPKKMIQEDNRIKADPTKSPYKQCGYLETYYFIHSTLYTKQGTGALIDKNRFLTAGNMLYSHEDPVKGWATSCIIWVASQDGKGTLTDKPSSGQDGGLKFYSMNGWVDNGDARYDMGYVVMDFPLEQLAGKLNYAIPEPGNVTSNVVSYTGPLLKQIMWGNETVAINTPEYIFHNVTISQGSIGAPIIQHGAVVGVTNTLEPKGPMNQALAIRQEIYPFVAGN